MRNVKQAEVHRLDLMRAICPMFVRPISPDIERASP
jgi:hypothetical protein